MVLQLIMIKTDREVKFSKRQFDYLVQQTRISMMRLFSSFNEEKFEKAIKQGLKK